MTTAIITLLTTLIPQFLALWMKIRAENPGLNLQPASAFLADAEAQFNQIEADAAAEIAKG